jgi:hypothetical protein
MAIFFTGSALLCLTEAPIPWGGICVLAASLQPDAGGVVATLPARVKVRNQRITIALVWFQQDVLFTGTFCAYR